jgi:hypothetical protein
MDDVKILIVQQNNAVYFPAISMNIYLRARVINETET